MSSHVPFCAICEHPMSANSPFIKHETKTGRIGVCRHFPAEIRIKMFENYVCHRCKTRLKQLVQVAVYKNPQILKLLK